MYTLFIIIFRLLDFNDNLQNYSKIRLKGYEESIKLLNKIEEVTGENKSILIYIHYIMNYIFYKNEKKTELEEDNLNLIKNKHSILFKKHNEKFMVGENKKILNIMNKGQKHYNSFAKLAKIFRSKKEIKITTDLILNPLNQEMKNTIKINQNKMNYIFSIRDLINLIETNLCNSPDYFADPLEIKNPYNNLKFDKGILYTIYFEIKDSSYVLPNLFHNYFLCDFNMGLFVIENESLIRDINLKRIISNTSTDILFKNIKRMLKANGTSNSLTISKDVNKKEFVEIMKPYYYLYLMSNYHITGLEKTRFSHILLESKLSDLLEYNPHFGRTKLKRTDPIFNPKKWEPISDLDHPKFTMKEAKETSLKDFVRTSYNLNISSIV